jgi:hypothetical protein
VWLAPRQVNAAQVKTENGESEKYLFYRGVGHIDAPLRVVRKDKELEIVAQDEKRPLRIPALWLVDIRRDGSAACRAIRAPEVASPVLAKTPAAFAEADYNKKAVGALRNELRGALTGAGLFTDEADALLNTWELSYFKSAGTRLFFLVPQEWTDANLPLGISGQACETTRVMVGRIELVTPEQRALLKKLANTPLAKQWGGFHNGVLLEKFGKDFNKVWEELAEGTKKLSDVGVEPPEGYRTYLDLGRFRNALVLEEQKSAPSKLLDSFIDTYGLQAHGR